MFVALFLNPLLLPLIGKIATKDDERSVSTEEGDKKNKTRRQRVTRQWVTFFHQCSGISRQGLE